TREYQSDQSSRMLFSNELNYWVIKKNAKKYLLLRMGAPYQNLSQNVGTIAAIREDSDKIEWFWDTLLEICNFYDK
ncbi:hypothetical protein, partial [Leptospira borgpetersenii]